MKAITKDYVTEGVDIRKTKDWQFYLTYYFTLYLCFQDI